MHNRIPVSSTAIAAVAYSAEAALDIELTSGARYCYFAVPAQLFHDSSPPTPRAIRCASFIRLVGYIQSASQLERMLRMGVWWL
jgi:hypothetical protein